MKSLKDVLVESFASIYILTERDKDLVASFGTPDKPVSLEEFMEFWSALDEWDRAQILMDHYDPPDPTKPPFKKGES